MMGRKPEAEDLVLPLPPDSTDPGGMRPRQYSGDRFERDLAMLGLRHRRGHDLRRTFISLARSDGARTDTLRRVTHKPPSEVIEGYTTFEWEVVCREVMKLKLHRRGAAEVVALSAVHAMGESRRCLRGRSGQVCYTPRPTARLPTEKHHGPPRTRTGTRGKPQRILSPSRLPISTEGQKRAPSISRLPPPAYG